MRDRGGSDDRPTTKLGERTRAMERTISGQFREGHKPGLKLEARCPKVVEVIKVFDSYCPVMLLEGRNKNM